MLVWATGADAMGLNMLRLEIPVANTLSTQACFKNNVSSGRFTGQVL